MTTYTADAILKLTQHPDIHGSDEETARLLAPLLPAPSHHVYGPHIPLARAIVHEYLTDWEKVREDTRNTDIWDVAEYTLRVRIASALAAAGHAASVAISDAMVERAVKDTWTDYMGGYEDALKASPGSYLADRLEFARSTYRRALEAALHPSKSPEQPNEALQGHLYGDAEEAQP